MKKLLIIALASLLLSPAFSFAGEKELKPRTKCPVMGGDIDKKVYTDYKGRRVYFCCARCNAKFRETPEKYLKKMK